MKKNEYLESGIVSEFVDYLSALIAGKPFAHPHNYWHAQSRKGCKFNALSDAFSGYWFPVHKEFIKIAGTACKCGSCGYGPRKRPTCLASNNAVLDDIQRLLSSAVDYGDAAQVLEQCRRLMIWGGTVTGNVSYLKGLNHSDSNDGGVRNYLNNASAYFSKGNLSIFPFVRPADFDLRSNAGFTKIYSLIAPKYVIYDSRVAAALGLLVVDYCLERNISDLPILLNFGWMPARSSSLQRNPSISGYVFRSGSGNIAHPESNIMANWILSAAVERAGGKFGGKRGAAALRAVESALFAVGYDLTEALGARAANIKEVSPPTSVHRGSNDRVEAGDTKKTRAKVIYWENIGASRQEVVDRFISEVGLTAAGAATYYQNFKNGKWR